MYYYEKAVLFMLYGLHSVVAMSPQRLRDIVPQENREDWPDVYNRDDLYDYENCNNKMLDVRDLDKDFDWAALSLNILDTKKIHESPASEKKSMKNKKSTAPELAKRKRSEVVKLLSPLQLQQTQQHLLPQQQLLPPQHQQQQQSVPRFDVDPVLRKLKISNHN